MSVALLLSVLAACGGPIEASPRVESESAPAPESESGSASETASESESESASASASESASESASASASDSASESDSLAQLTPLRLPPPPTTRTVAQRPTPVASARLVRVRSKPNQVVDVDAWFAANRLTNPVDMIRSPRARVRRADYPEIPDHALDVVIDGDGYTIVFYRPSHTRGPLLAVLRDDGALQGFFDFRDWLGVQNAMHAMSPEFATVAGDVLYVSHMHRTYAATTGGQNAYLSAIDLTTGALLWRSAPLEANTRTFVVVGDVIVTGYGFTDEKDYLYVLDRHTGRRLHRARLEAGPRFILERQGRIYVRAYDRDYEYDLRVRMR